MEAGRTFRIIDTAPSRFYPEHWIEGDVRDRGTFADFPLEEMTLAVREAYGSPDTSTGADDDAFETGD